MGESKRVVFAIWGSLGDLHPYLAIGRELQTRVSWSLCCTTANMLDGRRGGREDSQAKMA